MQIKKRSDLFHGITTRVISGDDCLVTWLTVVDIAPNSAEPGDVVLMELQTDHRSGSLARVDISPQMPHHLKKSDV